MRRLFWTVGVDLGGFFLGGKGGGVRGSVLGLIWGASIGYGFGSIFDQTHATKRVVAYWGATLALVGPFFGLLVRAAVQPYDSAAEQIVAGVIGAAVGMLLGLLIGAMQLKRLRRGTTLTILFLFSCPCGAQEIGPPSRPNTETIYVGVIEDDRRELALLGLTGTGTDPVGHRTITPAFLRDASGWKSIQRLNEKVIWTVAFDGKKLGEVQSEPIPERQGTSERNPGPPWIHSIATPAEKVPVVGKPVLGFNGNFGALVRRPLVVVSRPNFTDPEQWKRKKLPGQVVEQVRAAFRKTFPHIRRCDVSGKPLTSDSKVSDSGIVVAKAYGSNRGSFLVETQLRDRRCVFNFDGNALQLLQGNQWFYVSPGRDVLHLGRDWQLADAGDYDGDGKSEIIFYVAESEDDAIVETEGYVLFYDNFHSKVRCTWNDKY